MLFGLEKSELGEWFPFFTSSITPKGDVEYDEPKPDAHRVRIRPLGPFFEERRKTRKQKYEWVLNTATRSMERVAYYPELSPDEAKQEDGDAWDFAITGVMDAKGTEIEFTREQKIEHMKHAVFNRFVGRCLQLVASAGAKAAEHAAGN